MGDHGICGICIYLEYLGKWVQVPVLWGHVPFSKVLWRVQVPGIHHDGLGGSTFAHLGRHQARPAPVQPLGLRGVWVPREGGEFGGERFGGTRL